MSEEKFIIRTTRDPRTGQIIQTKVSIPKTNPITPDLQQMRDLAIKNEELKSEIRDLKAKITDMEHRYKPVVQPTEPSKEALLQVAIDHPELIAVRELTTLVKNKTTGEWVEQKTRPIKKK